MNKQDLITHISTLPVLDFVKIYVSIFGYGYLYEQMNKYIDNSNDEQLKIVISKIKGN
jgi:hypothetical protein